MPDKTQQDTLVYTVQEAAALTELSEHTLRYYERAGLLPSIERTGVGRHRRYSPDDLQALVFLRRMRATGMPIHVLKRYMDLMRGGEATIDERREILEAHRVAVTTHIASLQECLDVIDYKLTNYDALMRSASPNEATPKPKQ